MKLKNIVVPAVFGFALSFFISIVVNHRFGTAFLRGFIFAVVFAAGAVVIDFIYEKFLNDGSSIDFSSDTPKEDSRLGGKVDITIDDAELTDDGDSLAFSVANNRFKLSQADTKSVRQNRSEPVAPAASSAPAAKAEPVGSAPSATAKAPAQPAVSEKTAFTPVSLTGMTSAGEASAEPVSGESDASENAKPVATDAVSPAVVARRAERVAEKKEIDALPDLDSFGDASDLDDDVIEDSEFAQDGMDSSDEGRIIFADGSKAKDHDTETLAKAIRTVLKRED
ncbi:MAG: hypothetical protein IJ828_03800 [Treponema sp.]|nr:hypothetical protein [Treponema sp.]